MNAAGIYYVGTPDEVAHHAEPLNQQLSIRIVSAEEVIRVAKPGDVCVFYNEYFTRFREACIALKERGCATLYAIDGILEWRNSWEFPQDVSCLWTMRPVLSHKVACIGRSQARLLESWGNLGKCELVGVPRLDQLARNQRRKRSTDEPFELLVMTAKAVGFTPQQRDRVKQSLVDLKRWIERRPMINNIPLQAHWRLTAGLDEQIGVSNELCDLKGKDLASALAQVDAVIATPSTAMLEAMLFGLPVALLDYNNCPHYVPAAWSITAPSHLDQVIPQLIQPMESKLVYQDTILNDSLECQTPAVPRMIRLLDELRSIAGRSSASGQAMDMPRRILQDPRDSHHLPEAGFDLQRLYPDHAVFSDMNRTQLQAEVGSARIELRQLRGDLASLREILERFERHPVVGGALRVRRMLRRLWSSKRASNALSGSLDEGEQHRRKVGPTWDAEFEDLCQRLSNNCPPDVSHVLLVPWLRRGGSDLETLNYVQAIRQNQLGQKVIVVATSNRESPWASRLDKEVTFIEFREMAPSLSDVEQQYALAMWLLKLRPAIIHTLNSSHGYCIFRDFGNALSAHSRLFCSVFCEDQTADGTIGGYAFDMLPYCFDDLAGVFCDNRTFLDVLHKRFDFDEKKLFTHYQPINLSPVRVHTRSNSNRLDVLWASRLDRQKRPDLLVEIASRCGHLPIHFHVYGTNLLDRQADVVERIRNLSNVTYSGSFDGFGTLPTESFDVFLYTSQWDGMPNIVLESLAAGLPVISANVGGLGEVITHRETGLLITPFDDVDQYITSLVNLHGDRQSLERLSANGRRRVATQHSWPTFVDTLRSVAGYTLEAACK